MPQDLIGCRKRRKLKALIPLVVVFVNDPPSAERKVNFAVFFIFWWSYGRKICLNMYHENSENSYGCSYLVRICLRNQCECIAELNPSASCWPLTRCFLIYQQTSADQNTVPKKILIRRGSSYSTGASRQIPPDPAPPSLPHKKRTDFIGLQELS